MRANIVPDNSHGPRPGSRRRQEELGPAGGGTRDPSSI
jgi:hypothetical protein